MPYVTLWYHGNPCIDMRDNWMFIDLLLHCNRSFSFNLTVFIHIYLSDPEYTPMHFSTFPLWKWLRHTVTLFNFKQQILNCFYFNSSLHIISIYFHLVEKNYLVVLHLVAFCIELFLYYEKEVCTPCYVQLIKVLLKFETKPYVLHFKGYDCQLCLSNCTEAHGIKTLNWECCIFGE